MAACVSLPLFDNQVFGSTSRIFGSCSDDSAQMSAHRRSETDATMLGSANLFSFEGFGGAGNEALVSVFSHRNPATALGRSQSVPPPGDDAAGLFVDPGEGGDFTEALARLGLDSADDVPLRGVPQGRFPMRPLSSTGRPHSNWPPGFSPGGPSGAHPRPVWMGESQFGDDGGAPTGATHPVRRGSTGSVIAPPMRDDFGYPPRTRLPPAPPPAVVSPRAVPFPRDGGPISAGGPVEMERGDAYGLPPGYAPPAVMSGQPGMSYTQAYPGYYMNMPVGLPYHYPYHQMSAVPLSSVQGSNGPQGGGGGMNSPYGSATPHYMVTPAGMVPVMPMGMPVMTLPGGQQGYYASVGGEDMRGTPRTGTPEPGHPQNITPRHGGGRGRPFMQGEGGPPDWDRRANPKYHDRDRHFDAERLHREREREREREKKEKKKRLDRDADMVALLGATKPTLSELLGHVHRMSRDQVGCRLLQQKLDEGTTGGPSMEGEDPPGVATAIFDETKPHLSEMMTDPFGNYLFQKVLEKITDDQRVELLEIVSNSMVDAALNVHGTRSVQKLVEVCRAPRHLKLIVEALRGCVVRMCVDTNGNHVIQRALQRLPAEHTQFIFKAVVDSIVEVSTHRHGCCVMQRCVDAATNAQRRLMVAELCRHGLKLMQDAYGNYVIQYVLDVCPSSEEVRGLCMCPLGHIGPLSAQKFSSNVMERCLEKAPPDVQGRYIDELAKGDIKRLMEDQYGNYVIQRALTVASHAQGLRLVDAIRPHLPLMQSTSGGRRIAAKILKRYPTINLGEDILLLMSRG